MATPPKPSRPPRNNTGKGSWSYNGNSGKWTWVGGGCLIMLFLMPYHLVKHYTKRG